MIEGAKEDLIALNKRRKQLIVDISNLKKRQETNIFKIHQDVNTYLEDHAEKYFGQDGEWAGKRFMQRFDASLKAMRSELKSLEQSIGISLHDMDEEMDRAVAKLAAKEKEFDAIEEQLHIPIHQTKDYDELLDKFLCAGISIDVDKEYQRLQRSIAKKEAYEEELNNIVSKREKQLEKELQTMRQVYREQFNQKRSMLETIAQSCTKDLDIKRQQYREQIDSERTSILKKAEKEQEVLHTEFMKRYQLALAAFKPVPATPSETDSTEPDVPIGSGPVNWKIELVEKQERLQQTARSEREEQRHRDQQLLQVLRAKQPIVLDPAPLTDIAAKLSALYLRYNDAIVEANRNR